MGSKPKYQTFAELVEDEVASGKYSVNEYLPGERKLADEHGLSRIAVRMGLQLLHEKGYLEIVPGKGYKVLSLKKKTFSRKSGQIGVIFAGGQSSYPSNLMVDGIFDVLHDADYQLIYASCNLSVIRQRQIIKMMVKRGVDGLLVVPEYRKTHYWEKPDEDGNYALLKQVYKSGTPVVLMDRSVKSKGLPCVSNDDIAISSISVEYLVERGHRNIVLFHFKNINRIARCRYIGYVDALEKHKLESMSYNLDKSYPQCLQSPEACKKEFVKMFTRYPDATGFILPSIFELSFHQVLDTITHKKRIEFIGIDQPIARFIKSSPYLERPMREIGKRAAEKIIRLIHNEPVNILEEYLKPKLIKPKNAVSIHAEAYWV